MPRDKFRTLARHQNQNLGRLSLSFESDVATRTLAVHLHTARDLPFLSTGSQQYAQDFHVRIYLLPAGDDRRVSESLFKPTSSARTAYKKRSSTHRACACPMFDEEFSFRYDEIWDFQDQFRIYLAVMCSDQKSQQYQCLAGMSWSAKELMESGRALPRWFWLLPKSAALQRYEALERVEDLASSHDRDVRITGRARLMPNNMINGTYIAQEQPFEGHPLYKHSKHGLYLYFHPGRRAWAIAEVPGSAAPYAFCTDAAAAEPSQVRGPWFVFSRSREYRSSGPTGPDFGRFEQDDGVVCQASSAVDSPTKSVMASPSILAPGPFQSSPPKHPQPNRPQSFAEAAHLFVDRQGAFLETLAILRGYCDGLRSVLTTEEHQVVFPGFEELYAVQAGLLQGLVALQEQDGSFSTNAIATLLHEFAGASRTPILGFCSCLETALGVIRRTCLGDIEIAQKLEHLRDDMQTPWSLQRAIIAPVAHVKYDFVASVQDLLYYCGPTHPARQGLESVLREFQAMSVRCPMPPALEDGEMDSSVAGAAPRTLRVAWCGVERVCRGAGWVGFKNSGDVLVLHGCSLGTTVQKYCQALSSTTLWTPKVWTCLDARSTNRASASLLVRTSMVQRPAVLSVSRAKMCGAWVCSRRRLLPK
eukprot:m.231940 g.231940  ORF g.231940 m.231940 type:complete len:646 (-) comp10875_c0_seq23:1194-3131(-)